MANRDKKGKFIQGHIHSTEVIEKNRNAHLGKIPWNKGRKNPGAVNSGSFKSGQAAWNRGKLKSKVSYSGIHKWVYRTVGKAEVCEWCFTETAKKYEWANKSKEYKRDISDWVQLCTRCHRKLDHDSYHPK